MKVLENYAAYKKQITQLELDLKWLNKRVETVKETMISENQFDKVKTIIERARETEKQLNQYKNYVGYVEVILEALKEKYNGKKYEIFFMRFIQKRSLRYISREMNDSTTQIKKMTEEVLLDFKMLTNVLGDE